MKIALVVLAAFALTTAANAESADAVISRARAQMGPEEVLNAVNSIRYEGRVLSPEGEEQGRVRLYFRRPYDQRVEMEIDGVLDITVVNDLEGYLERRDLNTGKQKRVVLPANEVRLKHCNTMENLGFFRGPEQVQGTMEYLGPIRKLGILTDRVRYSYPAGFELDRYFDSTGKLIMTRIGGSTLELREKGQLESGGIQFPRRLETYESDELIRIIEFDSIEVNGPMDSELFAFPAE